MLLDWEYLLLIIGIKQRTTTDTFDFPFSCMDIVMIYKYTSQINVYAIKNITSKVGNI